MDVLSRASSDWTCSFWDADKVEESFLVDVPIGVVTIIVFGSDLEQEIENPWGKKVLNPSINFGWPLNKEETLSITPGVSILSKKNNSEKNMLVHCCKKDFEFGRKSIFIALLTFGS